MIRDLDEGISLASLESLMSEIAVPSTYNEPTVIWRMRHADGRSAQAVIDPMNSGMRVVWFVNDQPLYVRYFADWTDAIEWTGRLRTQQWTVGWRLSDDIPEGRPARSIEGLARHLYRGAQRAPYQLLARGCAQRIRRAKVGPLPVTCTRQRVGVPPGAPRSGPPGCPRARCRSRARRASPGVRAPAPYPTA